jgi:hypothetical protein
MYKLNSNDEMQSFTIGHKIHINLRGAAQFVVWRIDRMDYLPREKLTAWSIFRVEKLTAWIICHVEKLTAWSISALKN